MNNFSIFVVDAFTSTPFKGNPAAVCLVEDKTLSDEDQLKIASEMKHSETAFLQLINIGDSYDKSDEFNLRWFTPATEVKLCGHATLASAAVLFYCLGNKSKTIKFNTLSGQLLAMAESCDNVGDVISLDFPLNPPEHIEIRSEHQEIINVICQKSAVDLVNVVELAYSSTTKKLLIRLDDCHDPITTLGTIIPDFKRLLQLGSGSVLGVIVTAKRRENDFGRQGDVDFYSRYFAPWVGVDEDPVTGSAHTVLSAYWSNVLGKMTMKAVQCSRRSGTLWLKVRNDGRCEIKGQCSVFLNGTIKFEIHT